jgi:hypothetical protein
MLDLPIAVDDGVECEAVAPAGSEVVDADAGVAGRCAAGPSQEHVLGVDVRLLSYHDVRDLQSPGKQLRFRACDHKNSRKSRATATPREYIQKELAHRKYER